MIDLTSELIAKAKAATTAGELLELAKANGVELTEAEANTCFEQLHTNAAVSDDELEAVAGGGICEFFENFFQLRNEPDKSSCPNCGDKTNITNVPNITTLPNIPGNPDNPTFDRNITPLPYDSNDKNKIVFL